MHRSKENPHSISLSARLVVTRSHKRRNHMVAKERDRVGTVDDRGRAAKLKRLPADLNRWNSQRDMNEPLFQH